MNPDLNRPPFAVVLAVLYGLFAAVVLLWGVG